MQTLIYKNTIVSYTDAGKGKAIVLLHGFLENKTMWDFFIPELIKKSRVITIDLFGHGHTDCFGYIHTMEEMAECVRFVLAQLKIHKAFLVGHSMGGYVALAFAEMYPEIIKKMLLLNSTAREDNNERKLNRDRAIEAVKTNHALFTQLAIPNLFSIENRERLSNEIELVKIEALKTPLQGVIAAIEGMKIRKDRVFILAQSQIPITIVAGEKDPVLDLEDLKKQADLPNVSLEILPDGHMSSIENKVDVLRILVNFSK